MTIFGKFFNGLAAVALMSASGGMVSAEESGRTVVLTFDDSVASHATFVAPLLKKYGFGATFFITEGFEFSEDKKHYMTWQQIKELDAAGFEIGNHTRHHKGVAKQSLEELSADIEYIEQQCKKNGIPRPVSFCYPGYQTSEVAVKVLRERGYRFARAGGASAFDPEKDEPLLMPQAFDGKPESTLEQFKEAVAKARDGKIAVMTFHGVPDIKHPWVNTDPEKFESYMKHLKDEGCRVIALRDLPALVKKESKKSSVVMMPKAKLEPFLKAHCLKCHGPDKEKGDVRFDQISWEVTNNDTAQRWQDVLDVLNGGDMPPEDEPQPESAELAKALDSLTGALLTARRKLTDHGGEISMRRLNRREYANTIRDLFGFELSVDLIPEDDGAESFDTVGAEQYFTSSHFQKYLKLGQEIAARGFEWAGKPRAEATTSVTEPEKRVTDRLRTKLADLDNKMRMKNEGKTWKEMGFKDEGEMQIVFSQFKNRAGKPRRYLEYPLVEKGIYITEVNNETRRYGVNRGGDPRASYRYRIHGGINGEPPEIRKFVRITDNEGTVGVLKIAGTTEKPGVVEMNYQAKIGQRNVSLQVQENRADIRVLDAYLNKLDKGGEWASIWIDRLEIEGPFYNKERSFFEKLIHPEMPARGKRTMVWTDEKAKELIERFAFEAYRRRAPAPEFVDRLVTLFADNRASGKNFEVAMGEVLGVILASPGFLFLQENSEADKMKRQLDDRELAIRLAYFLWSAPPDEELYSSASDNSLSKKKVLNRQVERMLNDPKSASFIQGFTSQWAELQRFDAITVDESKYIRFNKGVRHSAYQEVLEFFGTLVKEDLPASNLIDSEFVVINSQLGEHYGIEGVNSNDFEKVVLPKESPRGGLLGQTAFLTMGSTGERSSPVIRGALVMEKLLHDKPAPPPPNVPELGADSKEPMSNRQMVELHQRKAQCASCHKKMDVIGFGLENFDVIAKWRKTEKVGKKEVSIEPGGNLPGGGEFANLDDLKAELLKEKSQLAEELVESLLAYGLGRTIEFSDSEAVSQILQSLEGDDYRIRSMIHQITASPLFRIK